MSLPLAGRTVLVTRPKGQTAGLAEPLAALGATVLSLPAIEIVPPQDFEGLDAALCDLSRFDWLVFTSVNGVEAARDRMDALGLDRGGLGRTRVAAVGPSTARAAREAFGEPAAVPEIYVGEAVAEAMGEVRGRWVLLLRADIARRDLPALLEARGALVEEATAYRIVRPAVGGELPERCPDWIALTSSSAVVGTRDALEAAGRGEWMREAKLACIGPLTAATARELGYRVAAMPEAHTIEGLMEAICEWERAYAVGTPSSTVPPSARAESGTSPVSLGPRRQGEPSPEELCA